MVYSVSLEKFAVSSPGTGVFTLMESTVQSASVSVTYTTRPTTRSATVLRAWTDDWVYLAINSSSSLCTIKVLKLPLSSSQSIDPVPVQALPEVMYVPASFSTRSPTFNVLHTSTDEHIAFVLQSSSADRDVNLSPPQPQDLTVASSPESTAPPTGQSFTSLPPIILTRRVTQLGDWQMWDSERDGKEPNLDRESDISEYVKGSYAAADQRFTVPIRSGLNWRRAITVSCW